MDRHGEAREAAARHARQSLQVYADEDGMWVVRGRLEPELGAVLVRALGPYMRRDTRSNTRLTARCASARRAVSRFPPFRRRRRWFPPTPTQAFVAAHRARGLAIDARTGCPAWLGERLDLAWAIGVLHPAANPGVP